jgi:hypothetical protein
METSNGEVRFNSPFTPNGKGRDNKFHLYVQPDQKRFFDFRSSTGGSLSYLFAIIGEEFTDDPDLPLSSIDELKKRAYALTSEYKFDIPRADLPCEYRPVYRGGPVYNYLTERGISEEDIAYYRMGEGTGLYHGWAIIPSYDQFGRCEYWVARNTDKECERRYDNPQSARKYHVAFLNNALKESGDGSIILCEGVFSAIVAGRSACASLGKFVTNNQISAMEVAGVRMARLCLDGDAWKETKELASRLLRRGVYVTIIRMPVEADPADMGREAFYRHLSGNEFRVGELDLLKMRAEAL